MKLTQALRSSLRQPVQFVWTEYPPCPASRCQGHDTKRVYLVHDLIEARLIQPNVAYEQAQAIAPIDVSA